MLPLIAVAAVGAAISAGAALYNTYKQGKIGEEEYKRRRSMLDEYKNAVEQAGPGKVAPPVSYELLQMIGQYSPEVAQYYEEQAPELITESDSQYEKAKQREVLDQLSNISQTGDDAISRAARVQAEFEASQDAKSRMASALEQQARMGVGGQGSNVLAAMAAQEQANRNQYLANTQAAADAQSRRLNALSNLGTMAGNVRSQNTNTEKMNRDIMNSFFQRVANTRNNYNQYAADVKNRAQLYNLQVGQDIANKNVATRNLNKDNAREALQQQLDNELKQKRALADIAFNEGKSLSTLYANNERDKTAGYSKFAGQVGAGISSVAGGMAGGGGAAAALANSNQFTTSDNQPNPAVRRTNRMDT